MSVSLDMLLIILKFVNKSVGMGSFFKLNVMTIILFLGMDAAQIVFLKLVMGLTVI